MRITSRRIMRLGALLGILVVNLVVPVKGQVDGCEGCYWCYVGALNEWQACCWDIEEGGAQGCAPHWDDGHGWHCDGYPCIT